jgi:hypothetical protein
MYAQSTVELLTRTDELRNTGKAERLRRAGYYDGEPRPRVGHHWANLGVALSSVRRMRGR